MNIGNINKQGNWSIHSFWCLRDTYYYWHVISSDWWQYKTHQDTPYFGIWINYNTKQLLTFAEGDETLVECLNQHQFIKELHSMDKFYRENV